MRALCVAAGVVVGSALSATAHDGFPFGYSSYAPNSYYGFHAPYYPPVYGPPAHFGGWGPGWGGWGHPGYVSGVSYTYSYYTHYPGYSFDYHRGHMPRYYPGPFGGYGGYGYGPYGW